MNADKSNADARRREDALYKTVDDTRARWTGFMVGGNAGGVIATLSLIGATAARATPPGFPGEYLVLLVVFLLGLFGGLLMIAGDHIMAGARWKGEATPLILFPTGASHADGTRIMGAFRFGLRLARSGAVIASLCMLGGAIGGVIALARLARW